ncbi:hypothetical protein VY88_19995 [Azospirillum thiophilum]|uniref:Uncharacterized protein n=1 Tax=Azospirillum thiophilum TaxID=528244 RepID=A0AAC8ZW93_9PROT|nr:hypothetical protein [Azospirillum thiophilum]ALG74381.1 hypothetical protein AL072_25975 [Azospirillum thiophilum]KJR63750.1 hypothetical protein VY88_19995 [Azospirillum thiophilum]
MPTTVSMSPVLKQILWGGSSISLNLITVHKRVDRHAMHFFDTPDLNRTVLFKHPNFHENKPRDELMLWSDDATDQEHSERPIETGIYSPLLHDRPEAGGEAIYLRMKNCNELLEESFGVSEQVSGRDLSLLNVIDNTPSLDPFLLRTSVEDRKIPFNHELWNISDQENEKIRNAIAGKIRPIIEVALFSGADNIWSSARVDDFLKAIWNPDLPDAQEFVASFGFDLVESASVFSAWKGVTFYELQVMRGGPKAVELLKWLRSPLSVPLDITSNRMYEQQLTMFIEKVANDVESVLHDIRLIMSEYEQCLADFQAGRPEKFRDFLRTCRRKYWLMGYCVSAINNVALSYQQYKRYSSAGRMFYHQMNEMLRHMSVALDRRRERPLTF